MGSICFKPDAVGHTTDKYFTNTRKALEVKGINPIVTYRVFMRTDVIAVHKFWDEYLEEQHVLGAYADANTVVKRLVPEGKFAPAKTPLFEITGRMQSLVEHETALLWHVGWPSLCAYNAWQIRQAAGPNVKILDMAARHCPGPLAVQMASYAAHLAGFDGASTDLGAATFDQTGLGTMPHAWIGNFDSTVEAAKAFIGSRNEPITVLVDYFGKEISDSLECFKALGDKLKAVRLDTHGGRFCEGVTRIGENGATNYDAITRLRNDFGIQFAGQYGKFAYGKGVTVESVFALREAFDRVGANKVGIVVSSGFTPEKCEAFMRMGAPVWAIGTGSFLPIDIRDTYATADIIRYDGRTSIKVGREWLAE